MYTLAHAYIRTCAVYLVEGGLIIEANIPVQELEGQRGEGAYFRRGLIFGRIRYYADAIAHAPNQCWKGSSNHKTVCCRV